MSLVTPEVGFQNPLIETEVSYEMLKALNRLDPARVIKIVDNSKRPSVEVITRWIGYHLRYFLR